MPKEGSSEVIGERKSMQSTDIVHRKKILENLILALIWVTKIFFEVSALLDVRHCPKLQSCAISRKTNDVNLRK